MESVKKTSIIENNIIRDVVATSSSNVESFGIGSKDTESALVNNKIYDIYASSTAVLSEILGTNFFLKAIISPNLGSSLWIHHQ